MKLALVLSGGGYFGAWQAGAWQAIAAQVRPELVVGASVGSLNGWAIAGGAAPEDLVAWWRRPEFARVGGLPETIRMLMSRYSPRIEYRVVLTDALRMRPVAFGGAEIDWRYLAASCALPGWVRPRRIGGRWYVDGGLLDPVPLWAAVEAGATQIIALDALALAPSALGTLARWFRAVVGFRPAPPADMEVLWLKPPKPLGTPWDAMRWRPERIAEWVERGRADAADQIKHFP